MEPAVSDSPLTANIGQQSIVNMRRRDASVRIQTASVEQM
jgi:hypothetical protein